MAVAQGVGALAWDNRPQSPKPTETELHRQGPQMIIRSLPVGAAESVKGKGLEGEEEIGRQSAQVCDEGLGPPSLAGTSHHPFPSLRKGDAGCCL